MNETLQEMLWNLEAHRLEVQLAPSKRRDRRDHDMIRVVCDHGPKWYRRLCSNHTSSRAIRRGKHDTRIKRANVLSVLRTLVTRGKSSSKYAGEILAIAARLERKTA